jgi:hypothetical protein
MSTETWILIWKIVLTTAIGAFAILSLWVIIFGFRDIKRMLREL